MHNRPQIYCSVRRKWIDNTPEEEVRQNLINYLHIQCGAPLQLMACEYPLHTLQMDYRADLLLFDRKGRPLLLAECKAPSVAVDAGVFDQIGRYNAVLRVPYLLVTNGTDSYCCRARSKDPRQGYDFLDSLPAYPTMIDSLNSVL